MWVCADVVAVGGRCYGSGGCVVVVVVDGDNRDEIIYYFNV